MSQRLLKMQKMLECKKNGETFHTVTKYEKRGSLV